MIRNAPLAALDRSSNENVGCKNGSAALTFRLSYGRHLGGRGMQSMLGSALFARYESVIDRLRQRQRSLKLAKLTARASSMKGLKPSLEAVPESLCSKDAGTRNNSD